LDVVIFKILLLFQQSPYGSNMIVERSAGKLSFSLENFAQATRLPVEHACALHCPIIKSTGHSFIPIYTSHKQISFYNEKRMQWPYHKRNVYADRPKDWAYSNT